MVRIPVAALSDCEMTYLVYFQLNLATYTPVIAVQNLVRGVDNVRYDVYLSPRFSEEARAYVCGLIARNGNVADLILETPRP